MTLLSMQHICKYFFGNPANNDISFEVAKGEIHALLGENGAGKTTLMNILYGIYEKDSGTIFWKNEKTYFTSPKEAILNNIGMVHQHFMLIPTLTVSENITLGLKSKGYPFPNRESLNRDIRKLSKKYSMGVEPEVLVSRLSVGEEQRVEIIKLLYRNAELLILDEPTAVLTPQETEHFFSVLVKLKKEGHSVILITHKIPEVLAITDRITVLRDGCKIRTLNTADTSEEELSNLMIGRPLKPVMRGPAVSEYKSGPPGLTVDQLSFSDKGIKRLSDITFSLYPGEIFGIAGVDGNGQKELAECILGLKKPAEGSISLCGKQIENLNVAGRKKLGLAYISDDRHRDGLVMDMDLVENYLLKIHMEKLYVRKGIIDYQACRRMTETAIASFNIRTRGSAEPVRMLSGGNQQKLILAREMEGDPIVLLAFQPTRGLDIGATEFIQKQLLKKRDERCSILLISADLDEILTLSDRIGVMYKGRIQKIMENREGIDVTRIGLLMAGSTFAEAP